jgi:hypothetical protein
MFLKIEKYKIGSSFVTIDLILHKTHSLFEILLRPYQNLQKNSMRCESHRILQALSINRSMPLNLRIVQ